MITPNLSEEPTTPPQDPSDPSANFSNFITVFSAIFLIASVGVFVWSASSFSPLDRVTAPERTLERLTSRSLEFEDALHHVNHVERFLYGVLGGNFDVLEQAIIGYQELASYSSDPIVDLYLAILNAEAGNQDDLADQIQSWKERAAPFPLYSQFLQFAYFDESLSLPAVEALQANLAEEVPDNWFYGRLAIRIAKKSRDTSFEMLTQQHLDNRGHQLLWLNRLLIVTEVGACLIGLVVMVRLIRRMRRGQSTRLRMSRSPLPPPWTGMEGFAVLVRGGAVTTLLIFLLFNVFPFFEMGSHLIVPASMIILYGPILLLAKYYLLVPNNLTVIRAFGLRIAKARGSRVLSMIFALTAAGLFGDWMISLIVGVDHRSFHWTEWFDQNLVWGTPNDVVVTLVQYAIIAPLFEEFIFRGVLFASLRRKFGWGLSAVFSALVFSLVHGYGLVGMLTVSWSGLLWAWSYEKSGSLWPGIVAHGINNLLASLTLVALFR